MDLRGYYRKIQDLESSVQTEDVYLMSLVTPDGGRAGVITQMPRRAGCQMVVDGKARLAQASEIKDFEEREAKRREELKTEEVASRIQVQVIAGREEASGKSAKGTRS